MEKQKALYNNHESVINKTLSHRVVPRPDWFSSGKVEAVHAAWYLYSPLYLLVKAMLTFSEQKETSKPSFAMNSFKYLESHKEERDGCLQLFELLLRGFDSD